MPTPNTQNTEWTEQPATADGPDQSVFTRADEGDGGEAWAHGCRTAYVKRKCRCGECRAWNREYRRARAQVVGWRGPEHVFAGPPVVERLIDAFISQPELMEKAPAEIAEAFECSRSLVWQCRQAAGRKPGLHGGECVKRRLVLKAFEEDPSLLSETVKHVGGLVGVSPSYVSIIRRAFLVGERAA